MRKILVAIPYLNSGGVEVSLIRFLNELSKNKDNKIDLLMLKKEGMYLKDLPKTINILEVSYDDTIYSYERKIRDFKQINGILKKNKFLFFRMKLKRKLQKNDWPGYYKLILKHVKEVPGEYDLAIDWHGYGHFITSVVAEKIKARKKVFWVHDEKNEWVDKIDPWTDEFDKIYCVSKACKKSLLKHNLELKEKTDVFYNIIDVSEIRRKSLEDKNIKFDNNKLNIVTIGRLEWQKGYDIALLVAKKLKDNNINFCWYIIGGGHEENMIKDLITKYELEGYVKLLGIIQNPFPYVKASDIYVQPSRHEGYGLAILEAKILGTLPIATNLKCIKEQITNYENGILCELTPDDFSSKIIEVISNPKLKKKIENNLSKENFDYTLEFEKLYRLMEE